jgi:hypothetical protein
MLNINEVVKKQVTVISILEAPVSKLGQIIGFLG